MTRGLAAAVAMTWPHRAWIVATGAAWCLASSRVLALASPLAAVAALLLAVVVMGRITAPLVPGRPAGAWTLIRFHVVDYLLARVVVALPAVAVGLLASLLEPSQRTWDVMAAVVRAALAVTTLYAMPLVFLERKSLTAVLAGVVYLAAHPLTSAPVAGAVVTAHGLLLAGALPYRHDPGPGTLALLLAVGVAGAGLLFLAYAWALRLLTAPAATPAGATDDDA